VTTFGLKLMSGIHGTRSHVAGFFSFWDEHVRPALA
jgi:hypothetical protein